MKTSLAACLSLALLAACLPADPPATRPMDEVPVQQRLATGKRQYGFANGCVIVIAAERAVVVSEAAGCELYQRDIALLYASGD